MVCRYRSQKVSPSDVAQEAECATPNLTGHFNKSSFYRTLLECIMDVVSYIWLYHVELLAIRPDWGSPIAASFPTFRFLQVTVDNMENKMWKVSKFLINFAIVPSCCPLSICCQYRFTSRAWYFEPDFITADTNDVNASHSIMPLWEIQGSMQPAFMRSH